MGRTTSIAARALCYLMAGLAANGTWTYADERGLSDMRKPIESFSGEPTGYVEVTDADSQIEQFDTSPTIDEQCSAAIECCDACDCATDCDFGSTDCRSGWIQEIGVSALQSQMATSDLDTWPDDLGPAARITLGYEWDGGLGIRTQAWGYSMEGDVIDQSPSLFYFDFYPYYYYIPGALNQPLFFLNPNSVVTRRIELSAATVYLDFYKSILSPNGELAIGMGPAFGHLEFNFQPAGHVAKYYGGGISVFGQGYYPFVRRDRWEFALTGQSRVTLLAGNWEIEVMTADTEHSESMSILELGVGPEFRCRIGRAGDRYWFLRTLAEFQQWRSDRMGPISGDTLALQGASINFGVLW